MNITCLVLAAVLSTGVEIPDEGVPTWEGGPQYTTRTEKCPAQINDEANTGPASGPRPASSIPITGSPDFLSNSSFIVYIPLP